MMLYLKHLQGPSWVQSQLNGDFFYSMRFSNNGLTNEQQTDISEWFAKHGIQYNNTKLWWSFVPVSRVGFSITPDKTVKGVLEFRISSDAYHKLFKHDDPEG